MRRYPDLDHLVGSDEMIRHLLTAVDAGGFGLRDDGLKVTVIDVANSLLPPVSSFPPPFASFRVFRGPKCIGTAPTNLTTDFTDSIWIKSKRTMPQIHPDPILSPSVVKTPWSIRVLVSRFSTFPIFIFSAPALFDFASLRALRG